MATSNEALANKLAVAQSGAPASSALIELREWHKKNAAHLANLLGGAENAERLFLSAVHSISRVPKLLECNKSSLTQCLMQSAHLDLYPGPLQECAYLPFRNRKNGMMEAVFVPMYQGLIKLALQSRMISNIRANVVYEKDQFEYAEGTTPYISHAHSRDEDAGPVVAAYCTWKNGGEVDFELMFIKEIEAIRQRSPAARSGDSPWNSDYAEMCKKTVIKRASKRWPKSIKLAQAIEIDNEIERPDLAQKPVIDFDLGEVEVGATGGGDGDPPSP